jgi:hypothetical protein
MKSQLAAGSPATSSGQAGCEQQEQKLTVRDRLPFTVHRLRIED